MRAGLKRALRAPARGILLRANHVSNVDPRLDAIESASTELSEETRRVRGEVDRVEREMRGPLDELAERVTADHEAVQAVAGYVPSLLEIISAQNAVRREARREEIRLAEALAGLQERLGGELARLRERMAGLEAQAEAANSRSDEQGPELDSQVAATMRELGERIAWVERRGETIRGELMFELRYGSRGVGIGARSANGDAAPIEPRIVDVAKVESARDNLQLNLGAGHLPLDGFVNVDARELDGVDVVAEIGALPFPERSVARIHSAHTLEHFPEEELRRRLLPHWWSRLVPGGRFTAVVPDAESMIREHVAGHIPFDDLRLVTFGAQDYAGDFHFTMFSKESLTALLEGAGFCDVAWVAEGRRNGLSLEMEVAASRPLAKDG